MEREKKAGFLKKTEWIAIVVVMHYCALRFLESTTFHFEFSKLYRAATLLSLVLVGASRLLFGLWGEYKEKKNTKALIAKLLIIAVSGISSLIVELKFDYTFFLYLVFAAFCLYGINVDLVLKCFRICIGAMLATTVLCCLAEAIPNYLYFPMDQDRSNLIRASYGICYPTDFSSYLLFLSLLLWCGGKRKPLILILGIVLLSVYLVYSYANSITSELCFVVFIIAVLIESLGHSLEKRRKAKWIIKIADGMAVSAFPLLGFAFYIMTWLCGQGNAIAKHADAFLHKRLSLAWNEILQYGVNLFGSLTPQNGYGGGDIQKWIGEYEFIDSTYALLLIRYGLVLTLVIMIVWTWLTIKAIKTGHRTLAYAMAVIAVHAFSEHHFPELNYNIFLAIPLCGFALKKEKMKQEQPERKVNKWVSWIVGAGVTAVCIMLLPRILSRMRTVFELKGWTGNSLLAFLFCLLFVVLVGLFCFFLIRIIATEKKHATVTGVICSVIILAIMSIWSRSVVNKGLADKQLSTEAINTILSASTEPVYADTMEEGYEQQYIGISCRIWSLEEMARIRKGTIITSREPEANKLIESGAIYAELSDEISIYTYDWDVVNSLRNSGYTLHGYYYTERELDNKLLAELNDLELTENGGILLSGEKGLLTEQPDLALYGGKYQTVYSLSADPEFISFEGISCIVAITAFNGEQTILKKEIRTDEFDNNGRLEVICDYDLESSPGVKYEIRTEEDTPIVIDRIAWRRNPAIDIWRRFNEKGQIIEEYYNPETFLCNRRFDEIQYFDDSKGNNADEQQYETHQTLAACDEDYCIIKRDYGKDGEISLTSYYDARGKRIRLGSSFFHDYLQSLIGRNICIILSIRDEGTHSLTQTIMDDLYKLGIQTSLLGKYRYSFYAIIEPENTIEAISNTKVIQGEYILDGKKLEIKSGGWYVGSISSIILDGTEYSKNVRGMNIVLYDQEKHEVIESVAFDTCAEDMHITR